MLPSITGKPQQTRQQHTPATRFGSPLGTAEGDVDAIKKNPGRMERATKIAETPNITASEAADAAGNIADIASEAADIAAAAAIAAAIFAKLKKKPAKKTRNQPFAPYAETPAAEAHENRKAAETLHAGIYAGGGTWRQKNRRISDAQKFL